jgi:hypothetical protein
MTAEAFDLAAVEARALSEARNHYRRILEVRRPQQQGMADRDKEFCAACMALGVWRKTDAGYGLTHDQFEQLIDQRLQAAGLFCNIDAYHRVPTEKHDEEDDEDEEQDQEEEDAVLAEQVRQKIDKIMRDPLSFIEALAFHLKMGLALPAEFREPENQSITSLYVPGLHDVPAFEDIPPALPEPARPFLEVAPTAIVPAFPPLFAYADDQSAPRGKYEVFPAEDYLPMMDDVYGYDCGCGNSPADDTMHPLDTTARHDHFSPRTRLGQGLQNETTKATIPVEDHIQGIIQSITSTLLTVNKARTHSSMNEQQDFHVFCQ